MVSSQTTLLIILAVLFLFSAFFSASEAALIALNKIRLRHMLEEKRPGAARIQKLVSRMDKLIATILVGNNLVNTAIASIATVLITGTFGEQNALIYGTLCITIFLIIFGDLTPKIFATNHPEGIAFLARHLLDFFLMIFGPVTRILTGISNGIIRVMGGNPHHRSPLVTEEEIKMMITIGKEQGFYGDSERKMLERIFHFDEIEVKDVMTPRDKMTAVPVDVAPDELERIVLEEGHNRIPVYEGSRGHVIGILYVRDLLYLIKHGSLFHLRDLVSAPYCVSPKKKVNELLKEFQARKIQIAIVHDHVTKSDLGLVTLEDLIEEIVGEIEEVEGPPA